MRLVCPACGMETEHDLVDDEMCWECWMDDRIEVQQPPEWRETVEHLERVLKKLATEGRGPRQETIVAPKYL